MNFSLFLFFLECLRKSARGDVTIRSPGNGKITINGKDITYFEDAQPREQVCYNFFLLNFKSLQRVHPFF